MPSFETLWSNDKVDPTFARPDIQSLFSGATVAEPEQFRPPEEPAGPDATASTHPKSVREEAKDAGKAVKKLLGVTPAESAESSPGTPGEGTAAIHPESPDGASGEAPAASSESPAPQPASAAPSATPQPAAPEPANASPEPANAAPQPAPARTEPSSPANAAPPPTQREAIAPAPNPQPSRTGSLGHESTGRPKSAKAGGRRVGVTHATYYKHSGTTASGEVYKPNGLTAAHRTLPFGMRLRVVNGQNGRSVVVRINDRVPHTAKYPLDLSLGSAKAIGMTQVGVVPVALYAVR